MAFLTLSPENLLTFPSQFDNAAWTKTRATITADATTAPDGTTTADTLVEDSTASNTHYITRTTGTDNVEASWSVYVQAAGREYVHLFMYDADATGNFIRARFGLSAESSATDQTGNGSVSSASIANVGSGWYRVTLTGTPNTAGAGGTALFQVRMATGTAAADAIYNGDGTSGVYLWGARLVEGAIDVPVAWGGALTRYAEIGTRAVAFDGTARSSVRSRKRVWEGITTAPMSQTDADALYDLLVSAPPLLAVGDITRHLDVSVHPSNVREAGVWSDASGAYRYSLQFDLREV